MITHLIISTLFVIFICNLIIQVKYPFSGYNQICSILYIWWHDALSQHAIDNLPEILLLTTYNISVQLLIYLRIERANACNVYNIYNMHICIFKHIHTYTYSSFSAYLPLLCVATHHACFYYLIWVHLLAKL